MEENNETDCCGVAEGFWNKYKRHSGKISITISILGGAGSVALGLGVAIGSVVLAITNIGVFFSGVAYEILKARETQLVKDNVSLNEEKKIYIRRLTNYNFPEEENDELKKSDELSDSTKLKERIYFLKNLDLTPSAFPQS